MPPINVMSWHDVMTWCHDMTLMGRPVNLQRLQSIWNCFMAFMQIFSPWHLHKIEKSLNYYIRIMITQAQIYENKHKIYCSYVTRITRVCEQAKWKNRSHCNHGSIFSSVAGTRVIVGNPSVMWQRQSSTLRCGGLSRAFQDSWRLYIVVL